MKNLYLLFSFVFGLSFICFAQNTDNRVETGVFNRKSITIVPVCSGNVVAYSKDMIAASYNIPYSPRYDYNIVSQSDLERLQKLFLNINLDNNNLRSMENAKRLKSALIQSGVFQQIVSSVGNTDSLKARFQRSQKRIITSASSQMKIEGPTVDQIKTLMNGCYIAIPILTSVMANSNTSAVSN